MRERPWDDLGGGPAGSTPPRGRRKAPTGRRPVVSYHPGASRRASRRLTLGADTAVTVAGGVLFSAAGAANAQIVSSTVRVADASSELDQSAPISVIVRAGVLLLAAVFAALVARRTWRRPEGSADRGAVDSRPVVATTRSRRFPRTAAQTATGAAVVLATTGVASLAQALPGPPVPGSVMRALPDVWAGGAPAPTSEGAPAPSSSSEGSTTAAHPTASTRTTTPTPQRSPASEALPTTSRSAEAPSATGPAPASQSGPASSAAASTSNPPRPPSSVPRTAVPAMLAAASAASAREGWCSSARAPLWLRM